MLAWLIGQVQSLWRGLSKLNAKIISEVGSAISKLRGEIHSAVNSAVRALERLIDKAEDLAQKLYKAAIRAAQDLFDYAINTIQKVEKALIAGIANAIKVAQELVQALTKVTVKWLHELEDKLQKIIKLAVQELRNLFIPWLAELQAIIDYWKYFLNLFMANPLGFILGIIQSVFLEWFSFLVAYGMGTLIYSLPPFPNFGMTGIPSPGGPGPGTPTGPMPGPTGTDESRFGNAPGWLKSLVAEHFPSGQRGNALDISYLESGWNTSAVNDTRPRANGECNQPYTLPDGRPARTEFSVGLFQINICAHGGSEGQWKNPSNNAEKAGALFASAGWKPWKYSADKLGL